MKPKLNIKHQPLQQLLVSTHKLKDQRLNPQPPLDGTTQVQTHYLNFTHFTLPTITVQILASMETRQTKQTSSTTETNRKESNPPSTERARERNRGFNGDPKHHLQSIELERRGRVFWRQRGMSLQERGERVSDKKKR
jgi:hypothetical protein